MKFFSSGFCCTFVTSFYSFVLINWMLYSETIKITPINRDREPNPVSLILQGYT